MVEKDKKESPFGASGHPRRRGEVENQSGGHADRWPMLWDVSTTVASSWRVFCASMDLCVDFVAWNVTVAPTKWVCSVLCGQCLVLIQEHQWPL